MDVCIRCAFVGYRSMSLLWIIYDLYEAALEYIDTSRPNIMVEHFTTVDHAASQNKRLLLIQVPILVIILFVYPIYTHEDENHIDKIAANRFAFKWYMLNALGIMQQPPTETVFTCHLSANKVLGKKCPNGTDRAEDREDEEKREQPNTLPIGRVLPVELQVK